VVSVALNSAGRAYALVHSARNFFHVLGRDYAKQLLEERECTDMLIKSNAQAEHILAEIQYKQRALHPHLQGNGVHKACAQVAHGLMTTRSLVQF
jgi:hypothetical protein